MIFSAKREYDKGKGENKLKNKSVIALIMCLIIAVFPVTIGYASELSVSELNLNAETNCLSVNGNVSTDALSGDKVYFRVFGRFGDFEEEITDAVCPQKNWVEAAPPDGAAVIGGMYSFSLPVFTFDPMQGAVAYKVRAYDRSGAMLAESGEVFANYVKSSGGSNDGSTGDNTTVLPQGEQTQKVAAVPTFDSATGTATAAVSAETLSDRFAAAKADANGVKAVEISVTKAEGATSYSVELPVAYMSGDANKKIVIKTDVGQIELPGDMLAANDVNGADKLSVRISAVNLPTVKDSAAAAEIGARPVIDLSLSDGTQTRAWSNPNASVTVSVPYEPTAAELADPEHLTVRYIDGNGVVSAVPTGRYDAATGTVKFTTSHFSKYGVAYVNKTFSDISGSYAKSKIEVIASKGIAAGTSATTYSPKESLTRGQFLVFLVKALGLDADFDSNFSDVETTDYYYDAAGIAKKLGITAGAGNNLCHPDSAISRQDMMVMAYKAMKIAKKQVAEGTAADLDRYTDAVGISDYAKTAVSACTKSGVVNGYPDGTINPSGNVTREEMAVVIYNIYNK